MKVNYLMILFSLALALCLQAQDVVPTPTLSDQDESAAIAAEEAAQQQAMQADWKAAAARAGRVRTYRAKVIDQDGKPVTGMKIGISSLTQRSDFFSSGIAWDTTDSEALTDKQGIALFTPAPFRKLEASPRIREPEFNRLYRKPYQRTPMPLTRYYENTDSAPRPPDKDGFNMVFEVYRYRGREPLGELWRSINIPNDGVERAVSLLCDRSDNKEVVPAAEQRTGPYDFSVTVKRPDVPYWNVAPDENKISVLGLRERPPYTLIIKCLNGGLYFTSDQYAIEAPTTGYVREVRWTSTSPLPEKTDERYSLPPIIFWKRATNPVSYGRLRLEISWNEMEKSNEVPKPITANIDIKLLFNKQGGRLFERADVMNRDNEPWITNLTTAQAVILGAQAIDPAQLPPADSVQVVGP